MTFVFQNDDAFHHAAKHQRSLLFLLIQLAPNLDDFPRFLRFNASIRRFAMKILPYFILITIGLILGSTFGWIGKCVLFLILFSFAYGYSMWDEMFCFSFRISSLGFLLISNPKNSFRLHSLKPVFSVYIRVIFTIFCRVSSTWSNEKPKLFSSFFLQTSTSFRFRSSFWL